MTEQSARRRSLLLAIIAFLVVLVIWQIPDLNGLLYPFRFFVTTVHELGHGLAAIVSGGYFVHYEVYPNGAGIALTGGGTRWLVVSAGYLGTAVFGAALLYAANHIRRVGLLAIGLGAAFAVATILFARSLTAILAGGIAAAALILIGWKAPPPVATFALNFLAIITGLNALLDLWGLLNSMGDLRVAMLGGVPNDAYSMSLLFPLPPVVWALIWIALAVGLLALATYYTFRGPRQNKAD